MYLLTVPRLCYFCGSFLVFVFCVGLVFLSGHCSLVVTCWERADLLAFLCVMFYCVFVTFPCNVLERVWCLIVLIPGLEVIKLEYSLKLKIKHNDLLLAYTCPLAGNCHRVTYILFTPYPILFLYPIDIPLSYLTISYQYSNILYLPLLRFCPYIPFARKR